MHCSDFLQKLHSQRFLFRNREHCLLIACSVKKGQSPQSGSTGIVAVPPLRYRGLARIPLRACGRVPLRGTV